MHVHMLESKEHLSQETTDLGPNPLPYSFWALGRTFSLSVFLIYKLGINMPGYLLYLSEV